MPKKTSLRVFHFEGQNGNEYRVEVQIGHQRMSRICRTYSQVLDCVNEIGSILGIEEAKFDTKSIPVLNEEEYAGLTVQDD